MTTSTLAFVALAIAANQACTKSEPAPAPQAEVQPAAAVKPAAAPPSSTATTSDADHAAAKDIWTTRCTPCHGTTGAGDGPASAGLTPKPRNFQDAEWHATVGDEYIQKIIVFGGMAVGKNAAMPPNPDLDAKPSVVAALRAHVRSMKK